MPESSSHVPCLKTPTQPECEYHEIVTCQITFEYLRAASSGCSYDPFLPDRRREEAAVINGVMGPVETRKMHCASERLLKNRSRETRAGDIFIRCCLPLFDCSPDAIGDFHLWLRKRWLADSFYVFIFWRVMRYPGCVFPAAGSCLFASENGFQTPKCAGCTQLALILVDEVVFAVMMIGSESGLVLGNGAVV